MTTKRLKMLQNIKPGFDLANPPTGVRLNLGSVASAHGVTITVLAARAQISRAAIADLFNNRWPVHTDAAQIRTALLGVLEEAGATDDELASLFYARGHVPAFKAGEHGVYTDSRALPAPFQSAPQPDKDDEMLLPKQTLTPQARQHFRLFANPFDGEVTADEQMFVGDHLRYCQEAMRQCAKLGGFVAVVGESGAGKTTLLQDLEVWLEAQDRSVIVIRPGVLGMEGNDTKGKAIKSADILHAIITRLDPQATVPQTLQSRTVKAGKLLSASAGTGNTHLLVVEEAHSMPDATLKHLKRLHEMRLGRRPLLGILLLAQPELKHNLADGLRNGSLREVAQRCEIVDVLPLDGELKTYLQRRCSAVNVQLDKLMDDEAVEQLRKRLTVRRGANFISLCYPLAVNNLVTRALNEAAKAGAPKVTKSFVDAA